MTQIAFVGVGAISFTLFGVNATLETLLYTNPTLIKGKSEEIQHEHTGRKAYPVNSSK